MIINENKKYNTGKQQISIEIFKFEKVEIIVYLSSEVNKSNTIQEKNKKCYKSYYGLLMHLRSKILT